MTALRAHHRGGPEALTVEAASVPVPAAGEVLVAVHAAAITFDELTWEETWTRNGVSRTPVILSHEFSGVFADIATGVTDFRPGDQVYGLIRFDRDGAAADYVAVPAADVAAKPSTVSHIVAAALPLAGLTALQALVNHGAIRAGQQVLVTGGGGGVGALTVQLAHILGWESATPPRTPAPSRTELEEILVRAVLDTGNSHKSNLARVLPAYGKACAVSAPEQSKTTGDWDSTSPIRHGTPGEYPWRRYVRVTPVFRSHGWQPPGFLAKSKRRNQDTSTRKESPPWVHRRDRNRRLTPVKRRHSRIGSGPRTYRPKMGRRAT